MLKEFVNAILDLKREIVVEENELPYSTIPLTPIRSPVEEVLNVNTLSGLIGVIEHGLTGYGKIDLAVHIVDQETVNVIRKDHDDWERRTVLIHADINCYPCGFKFGRYYDPEEFVIALQSQFVKNKDLEKVLKIVGNVSAGKVTTMTDNGVTQKVSQTKGVTLQGDMKEAPNPVLLAPYRTFREIDQPESQFVLRFRQNDEELPDCALFEADGSTWKIQAIISLSKYFKENIKEISVIA